MELHYQEYNFHDPLGAIEVVVKGGDWPYYHGLEHKATGQK